MRWSSTRWYALCLLAGASLAVAAGALHPALRGDGAAQLAAIAACPAWRRSGRPRRPGPANHLYHLV